MGYSKEHVARTRARILQAAGRLFRKHGYEAVGIDRIMNEAGLTRGGFYAHFKTKADLFAAVMAQPLEFTNELEKMSQAGIGPRQGVALALEYYLRPDNREKTGAGCAMAALALESARKGLDVQTAFTGPVEDLVRQLADQSGQGEEETLALVSTAVGALILSRATSGQTSDKILHAAWAQISDVLET